MSGHKQYKYIMRLFEIAVRRLYLCSTERCAEGAVISCTGTLKLLDPEFETILEAKRPNECCPRQTSVFLQEKPIGTPFTYFVHPIGPVERNHTGWLALLRESDPTQSGVMQAHAIGYWSGEECPEARQMPWEHRVASIKIIRRIGASAEDRTVYPTT